MAQVKRIPCDTAEQLRAIASEREEWAKAAEEKDLHGSAAEWRLTAELARKNTMTLQEFHNGLRILTSVDFDELVKAGVIEDDDEAEWTAFRANPHRWMISADDEQAEKLWGLINARR